MNALFEFESPENTNSGVPGRFVKALEKEIIERNLKPNVNIQILLSLAQKIDNLDSYLNTNKAKPFDNQPYATLIAQFEQSYEKVMGGAGSDEIMDVFKQYMEYKGANNDND